MKYVEYITVTTGIATVPFGLAKLAGGLCFSLGLMLVVVCGADIFTSTVLTIVAKATGKVSWKQMFVNWFHIYIGNLVGALLFVALIWFAGQYMVANGQWGLNVLQTANHKLDHTFLEALCSYSINFKMHGKTEKGAYYSCLLLGRWMHLEVR